MNSFTDQQITKWANTYEREIAAKYNFIADRISLAIIAGQSEYELPNYVTNIRSVLYLGRTVVAKGFRSSIFTGDIPFSTDGSIPTEYIVSGKGIRVIKFLSTPATAIASYSGNLWTALADEAAVIIEFYRVPDLNDETLQLPDWFRRYIIKDYVVMKATIGEGGGQDIRSSNYYADRIKTHDGYLSDIKKNMFKSFLRVLGPGKPDRRMPGRPVLPSNFGYRERY